MGNDAERFAEIERIFHAAAALDPSAWPAFVAEAAPHDAALRQAVLDLLQTHAAGPCSDLVEGLFESLSRDAPVLPRPTPGQMIGPYRLLRELGAGGAGIVFEAEQTTTPRRHVALKLLHHDTALLGPQSDVLRREAEILARLTHPAIAALYDFDHTTDGRPYVVMELVEGQRLERYVRHRPRGERLHLFLKICDAIAYAHAQNVIHLDLKPSHILVRELPSRAAGRTDDHEPVIKVLDFGLARLVGTDAALTTLSRSTRGWGTLAYMSPEQRRQRRDCLDQRTDVYALGVVLFKLMTDELPYAIEELPLLDAWKLIEQEPPRRPSLLDPTLRGDLETIILNALAEDPRRRYQTVAELGEDIRLYLEDRTPKRRPPGVWPEMRRFVKRNLGVVAALTGVFLGLVAAIIGVETGARTARDIVRQAETSTDARNTITSYIKVEARHIRSPAQPPPLGTVSDPYGNSRFNAFYFDEVTHQLLHNVGPKAAADSLRELIGLAESALPAEHAYTAVLRGAYGEALDMLDQEGDARENLARSYEALCVSVGPTHDQTRTAIRRIIQHYERRGDQVSAATWRAILVESELGPTGNAAATGYVPAPTTEPASPASALTAAPRRAPDSAPGLPTAERQPPVTTSAPASAPSRRTP